MYTCTTNFGPFLPCVLHRMPELPISLSFFGHQRAKIESFLNFKSFFPCILLRLSGNANYTKFVVHQRAIMSQYWPKSNHFWRRLGYFSMSYFGPFLPCIFLGMRGTTHFTQFCGHQRAKFWPPEGRNCASTWQNRIISGGGQDASARHISGHSSYVRFRMHGNLTGWMDGRSDGRTDGRWPTSSAGTIS